MATVNFIKNSTQSATAMSRTIRYVERDDKTRDKQFVSGQNCTPQLAEQEFLTTRAVNRKDSGRWFYHYTQSFSPQENVTPEQAHEIAKEFAAWAWPESEVVIATHVDAEHVHSHFVVNAVCFETGRMLRQHPDTLQKLRAISDELCMAHGLSVLPSRKREQKSSGVSAREYRSAAKGESWKFQLMAAVDDCMRLAQSREEFIEQMKRAGYRVRWEVTRACITYTTPSGMRCRDKRLHEDKYRKENMEYEFRIRAEILAGRAQANEQPRPDRSERLRDTRFIDRAELDSSATAAGQDVLDARRDYSNARHAADEAGRGRTARADRALDADAARAVESDGGAVRAAGESDERPLRRKDEQPAPLLGRVSPEAGRLDAKYAARYDERDALSDRRADRLGEEVADTAGDRLAPAAGAAGDDLRYRHVEEAVSEATDFEENNAFQVETGWEKEREAFLLHLARGRWSDAPIDKTRRERPGMYRTLGVLKQTSHVLSSVGHALSGDSDEAAVVLGVLTGAAIGTALGIAEKHRQASAQQSDTPHNDSAQPTAEPRQDTASQQIEQSM